MQKKAGVLILFIGMLFLSIFFIGLSFAEEVNECLSDDDIIMKLRDSTNSHGALWNDTSGNYNYDVCYSDIFDGQLGNGDRSCHGNNIVWLNATSNSHASTTSDNGYTIPVCYGDLSCTVEDNGCSAGKMVVALYDTTNSHIADSNYMPVDMVSWWKLEGNADDPVNENNGVIYGATDIDGQIGNALNFDGDDYVEIPDDVSLQLTTFTTEAWFRMSSFPTNGRNMILSKGEATTNGNMNYVMGIYHSPSQYGDGVRINCEFENDLDANSWLMHVIDDSYLNKFVHVACTLDGNNWKMYVDGEEVLADVYQIGEAPDYLPKIIPSGLSGQIPSTEPSNLYIGAHYQSDVDEESGGNINQMERYFNGIIDEVAIYNRALTAQEVLDRYNLGAYEKKICCQAVLGAPVEGAYWANADGDPIIASEVGDTVKLIVEDTGLAEGVLVDFSVEETTLDNEWVFGGDGYGFLEGEVINGDAVGIWTITQADYDKTNQHTDYYFHTSDSTSDPPMSIAETGTDSPMTLDILEPVCGENLVKGDLRNVIVNVSDLDDIVTGNLTIDGSSYDATNGVSTFSHTFDEAGNIKLVLTGINTKGHMKSAVSNIMVVDENIYGVYVAACIDQPRDYQDIDENIVLFNATSTRAFEYFSSNDSYAEIDKPNIIFRWLFSDNQAVQGFIGESSIWCGPIGSLIQDCESRILLPYVFNKTFVEAGNNWAELSVEVEI